MESIKSVPNLPSFLELLKVFCFLKGSIISPNFRSYYHPNVFTFSKVTTGTFYAMSQHEMWLLKLYNKNISFMAAIKKIPVSSLIQ